MAQGGGPSQVDLKRKLDQLSSEMFQILKIETFQQ